MFNNSNYYCHKILLPHIATSANIVKVLFPCNGHEEHGCILLHAVFTSMAAPVVPQVDILKDVIRNEKSIRTIAASVALVVTYFPIAKLVRYPFPGSPK
jgi:hypothetical protein